MNIIISVSTVRTKVTLGSQYHVIFCVNIESCTNNKLFLIMSFEYQITLYLVNTGNLHCAKVEI